MMKAPIKRPGSKWSIASWINSILPRTEVFVDVFGGSAAIILSRDSSPVDVYNDVDSRLVNFWRVLRESPDELIRRVDATPYSREEFINAHSQSDDPIEDARRILIIAWQSHTAMRINGDGLFTWRERRGDCGDLSRWNAVPEKLRAVMNRLKQVTLENLDWREVMTRYSSPSTLFYLDPPYPMTSRTDMTAVRYVHDNLNHDELLEYITTSEAQIALSTYECEMYSHDTLPSWTRHIHNARVSTQAVRTEVLWVSPNLSPLQRTLWT